ncbi:MAG: hypothetical protein ACRCXZ_04130 [Patescibacteria group bacterium]
MFNKSFIKTVEKTFIGGGQNGFESYSLKESNTSQRVRVRQVFGAFQNYFRFQ